MGGKTAVAAGLVLGVLAGGALLGSIVVLAPDLGASADATPPPPSIEPSSPVASSPGASPQVTASPVASSPGASPQVTASPVASPVASSPGASPQVTASPSPEPSQPPGPGSSTSLFGVGQAATSLKVPLVGGGTIDRLQAILPGVVVAP